MRKVLQNVWKMAKSTWHTLNALETVKWDLSLTREKQSLEQPHRDQTLILPSFICLSMICKNEAITEKFMHAYNGKCQKKPQTNNKMAGHRAKKVRILWSAG